MNQYSAKQKNQLSMVSRKKKIKNISFKKYKQKIFLYIYLLPI